VYSVRDKATGKRKGCIGFALDTSVNIMILRDVKGYANTPPTQELEKVADTLHWMQWRLQSEF
jgi:hypothetical protein